MLKKKSLGQVPLVSIVTPSYGSGRFIDECIQSILLQDYPNVEHIIQDGGSKDQTASILRKYKSSSYKGRIKIFVERDNGQSDGLNRAIQKARGDVILVLNADDMLVPYAISWGVQQLNKYPRVGVVYGDAYIIDERGEIKDIYKAHEYDFVKLLCVELVPPAQAAFIRRSALEKVGFWADATLDTCPDYEMWVRIAQKFPMKHVFGVVTKYRVYKSPQLDSKQPRMTGRFVAAKREVMDRVFNSKDTPWAIKKLRRRAYASLNLWASQSAYNLGQPRQAFFFLLKSFLLVPTRNKFTKMLRELLASSVYRFSLVFRNI